MARKNKEDLSFIDVGANKTIIKQIQKDIDNAYKNTYYSDNDDNKYIDNIRRRMDQDINNLIDKNKLRNNGNNISQLYARTLANDDNKNFESFRQTLENETMIADLLDLYSQNAIQQDVKDKEYDLICKYVPKLQKALDFKQRHVLCADHFRTDNIEVELITNETGKADPDSRNDVASQYASKSDITSFKKKYDLINLAKNIYKNTAKYGEEFIYIVSYNKALNRLLKKTNTAKSLFNESGIITEDVANEIISNNSENFTIAYKNNKSDISLNESISPFNSDNKLSEEFYDYDNIDISLKSFIESNEEYNKINIEFNNSGVIPGLVTQISGMSKLLNEARLIRETDNNDNIMLLEAERLSNANYIREMNKKFKKAAKEGGVYSQPTKLYAGEGFTNINKNTKTKKEENLVNIPGCIVERLDHARVKKLVINKVCLGYLYIETNKTNMENQQVTFTSTLGGLRPRKPTYNGMDDNRTNRTDDMLLSRLAKRIAKKIDDKFINTNQDLAKEIYGILKYNSDHTENKVSKIRVTFIPPEDIVHSYFNLDEKTNRGLSDLHLSLFPAKLFSSLYISNVIALLTRGYDKRAYYVTQSVDSNIEGVLLDVISQIKRSNFNIRQIENLNNIAHITGRFNDFVIPRSNNGDSPINFEIIPGQNIEIKTDFMRLLEEMAVNLVGPTLEMIDSQEQSQTATYTTMTNTRILIDIFDRQTIYKDILSEIFTKIYQIEYGVNDELEVTLPPPVMLNFTNTSQILTVANELIQNILTMKLGQENPNGTDVDLRTSYAGKLMQHYFKTFLDMEKIEALFDEAKVEVATNRISAMMQPDQQQPPPQGAPM